MSKPFPTKTVNPIHFEDLEPHRFEDLSRQLIYDFRDWQSIEATGRGGRDAGFDIRAYEKQNVHTENIDEDEVAEIDLHSMKGNEWMIQCKREKTISPGKIKLILQDVDETNPPYGYILIASTNFSKESHDVFRQILISKGVLEFFLWGKDALEDMLYMPKNDRILFSFFGISFTSKRKARYSQIRSNILIKNKLFGLLGQEDSYKIYLLIRNINDENYPLSEKITDFNRNPQWRTYNEIKYGSSGIWVRENEFYAYFDVKTKEWDYTEAHDRIYREPVHRVTNDTSYFNFYHKKRKHPERFWECLPRSKRATYNRWGLVRYEDILLIDGKGDKYYTCPHIFAEFKSGNGPFTRFTNVLKTENGEMEINEHTYIRKRVFPDEFSSVLIGKVYKDQSISVDVESFKDFLSNHDRFKVILDINDKYKFLKSKDIIRFTDVKNTGDSNYIMITQKIKTTYLTYLEENNNDYYLENSFKRQVGVGLEKDKLAVFIEFKRVYPHEFE